MLELGGCWICNGIVIEGCIPEDWKSSVILPIYKGRGDPMECGSYRGIELLEHAMRVVEGIFGHRVWQRIGVNDMQFGFVRGKGDTDAIFAERRMQEKFRVGGKEALLWLCGFGKCFWWGSETGDTVGNA